MKSRWRFAIAPIIMLSLPLSAEANAAPVDQITECSHVEYRQDHLRECNMQDSPFLLGGNGGPCGLLCRIGGLLGGIF